jgi:hypothetical protein
MFTTSLSRKIGAVGLLGNVALIAGILYRRQEHLDEEEAARVKWETMRRDSELDCFFTAIQYFDQCSHEPDDEKECVRLAAGLDECKKKLAASLPDVMPAMLP